MTTKMSSVRNERGIATESTDTKKIIRVKYCGQINANNFDSLDIMDTFLEKHKLLMFTQEET